MSITESIKAEAKNLGFLLVGFSKPAVPVKDYEFYKSWVESGYHHSLDYLASNRAVTIRKDPGQLLPNCSSVISLGLPYHSPNQTNITLKENPLRGRVSSYAWNQDYHEVSKKLVIKLIERIKKIIQKDFNWKIYTDTGPLLERSFAQQSGLGWIGRNSMLISPQYGSFFFLTEILLDVDIEPDNKITSDLCGNCRKCIESCPTGCILPDRTIDTKKCIAYLTIENKGEIPEEYRNKIGNWVFGCDICQMVCPWNNKTKQVPYVQFEFKLRENIAFPDLLSDIHLTQEQFSSKFKNSPVKRAKRSGYIRNIAIALGNSDDVNAIPHLKEIMINSNEAMIRAHAAWALGEIGIKETKVFLENRLSQENNPTVISEINEAINNITKRDN